VDQSRFDEVVRGWNAGTRRGLLRLVGGTTFGALLLGQFGADDAAAKCVSPGKKCKGKDGKKEKCCGSAKCQGGKCRCKTGGPACGKACCAPGQVCQLSNPKTCVGPLAVGEVCNPDEPLGCKSGVCGCTFVLDVGTVCTCREAQCFAANAQTCLDTSECCDGHCSEAIDPHQCVPD
jgi:hypothetical protein